MNRTSLTGRGAPFAAALLAAAVVAACGGSSNASSGATKTSSQDAARVKLAQCLRAHGVNVSDNGGAPGGDNGGGPPANLDRTKLRSAMQACRKYQSAAFGNVSQSQRQEFQDAFAKFSSCMRQHGVEVRDPTSGGGQAAGGGPGLDRNDPKVKAAQQACQSKLGNLPGRGPAGGGN